MGEEVNLPNLKHSGRSDEEGVCRAELGDRLKELLSEHGSLGEISLLCSRQAVADDATKLLICTRDNRRAAVVLLSSPVAPRLVERGAEMAHAAREILGPQLGEAI